MLMCVCSWLSGSAFKPHLSCAVLYCHLGPVWLYHILSHYIIQAWLNKNVLTMKVCCDCLYNFCLKHFLIQRRIQLDINVSKSSSEVSIILARFESNLNFLDRFLKIVPWKSIQWEPSCCVRTDKQTDMRKLIVAFCNFVNMRKNHLRMLNDAIFSIGCKGCVPPARFTSFWSQHMVYNQQRSVTGKFFMFMIELHKVSLITLSCDISFCDMMLCRSVGRYQHCGEACCFSLQVRPRRLLAIFKKSRCAALRILYSQCSDKVCDHLWVKF